jgi:hypothetical protein
MQPRLILFVCLTLGYGNVFAENWTREQAAAFHKKVSVTSSEQLLLKPFVNSNITLPVSPGYDQGSSSLCWVYAALNALESNYLYAHAGSTVAISRAAMQYVTMADRYIRKIQGTQDYIVERGTVVDAVDLLRKAGTYGLVDYHQDLTPGLPGVMYPGTSPEQMIKNLYESLNQVYGALPEKVHAIDSTLGMVTPQSLGQEFTGLNQWIAYGSTEKNGMSSEGWGPHWDSDARPGTKAYFVNSVKMNGIIKAALSAGHAVAVSWCGHSEEIYGADFDPQGEAIDYKVKGSYGSPSNASSFLYSVRALELVNRACGLHTIQLQNSW